MVSFFKRYKTHTLFLLVGVFIGFSIERSTGINFEDEINVADFANLILTLILAILLAFYIEPINESTRFEKDLHIEQLKEIKDIAKSIHSFFTDKYEETPLSIENKKAFVTQFRFLSNHIDFLFGQIENSSNKNTLSFKNDVIRDFVEYKKVITGGAFNRNNFNFKSHLYSTYESRYKNFLKQIFKLIAAINKC